MNIKLQTIENELEKNKKYLEDNEEARNIVFNSDYTLRKEVNVGFFHYIYMGFCTHCYQGPCKNYSSHPLYEQYKKKYERYEEYLTNCMEMADADTEENDETDDEFYTGSKAQDLFMFQHSHYENIKKASEEYVLKMKKEMLSNFLYSDLVNIIAEYL